MSEKIISAEELKNVEIPESFELPEELLDTVAGGAMDPDTWKTLSPEEQNLLRLQSSLEIAKTGHCFLCE